MGPGFSLAQFYSMALGGAKVDEWVTVATAPNQPVAEMWRNLLLEQGIPAQVQPGDVASFLGVSSRPCRLLVPRDREEEARGLLANVGEG